MYVISPKCWTFSLNLIFGNRK